MTTDKKPILLFTLKRWLFCCLLFFGYSCNTQQQDGNATITTLRDSIAEKQFADRAWIQIATVKKLIYDGDIITRTGNDFTSESLRQLNQHDKTYSHCGIASIENDSVFVYHSLGGEFNPDQKIRRDRIEVFAEPYSNRGIAIFRFSIGNEQVNTLLSTVKKMYAAGIMFDMKFDLATDDRMYCAEFVYKSFVQSSKGHLRFNISHIKDFAFIGVDDLFMHPLCKQIQRILYK